MDDLLDKALAAVKDAHSDSPGSNQAIAQAMLLVAREVREGRKVQERIAAGIEALAGRGSGTSAKEIASALAAELRAHPLQVTVEAPNGQQPKARRKE